MKRATVMAIAVAMAAGGVRAQPVQWRVADGGNGHWYEIVGWPPTTYGGSFNSWTEADAYAKARGGHLASLNSGEQGFMFPYYSYNCFNFGGSYVATGGVFSPETGWRWNTGEPFTGFNLVPRPGQTNYLYISCRGGPWADYDISIPENRNPMRAAFIEWDTDCNGDGVIDYGQILSGQLPDANTNGIPDWSVNITRQPSDITIGGEQPAYFTVEVASRVFCSSPVVFRWQRRNPAIVDPTSPGAWIDLQDGIDYVNTGSASLTILRPTPAIATGYRCRVSGGCGCDGASGGLTFTDTVNFSVACPADFNADGGIDFGDVEAFFERWENGC